MGDQPIEPGASLTSDLILSDFQQGLDEISAHTRLVFFGMPNLYFPGVAMMGEEVARRLWFQYPLDDLNVPLQTHLDRTDANRRRAAQLKCRGERKCVFVDWSQAFCDPREGVCSAYEENSGIAYFIDSHHYSWLGCRRIWPLLEEAGRALGEL